MNLAAGLLAVSLAVAAQKPAPPKPARVAALAARAIDFDRRQLKTLRQMRDTDVRFVASFADSCRTMQKSFDDALWELYVGTPRATGALSAQNRLATSGPFLAQMHGIKSKAEDRVRKFERDIAELEAKIAGREAAVKPRR